MQPISNVHTLARHIGRHYLVYGTGVGVLMIVSLVNLAVFTRLMPPREFGILGLLLVLSTAFSVVYSLGTLQGTLGAVFGKGAEDDGDDDAGVSESDAIREGPEDVAGKREALGTGLLLTALFAGSGTVAVWILAPEISRTVLHSPGEVVGVRLAAVAGASGAVFRLLIAIPRLERRPRIYVTLNVARSILAILVAIPFVVHGDGASGVVAGLVIATLALIALALVTMRKAYRLRFRPGVVPVILKLGAVFVPVALSIYVINHAGVLILAGDVPPADIGLYVVAATLGGLILALATVFFMAWMPIKRTSLFVAVHKEQGHGWLYSTLTTYFVLGLATVYVVVTAGARWLVRIAGSEYAGAEDLIPVLGAAAVAHALFLLAYRMSAFPRKRVLLGVITAVAAVFFIAAGTLLVSPLGLYGVPIAAIAAFAGAAVTMLALNQRDARAIPFDYGRLLRIALVCALCVGGHTLLAGPAGSLRPLLDFGTVIAYALMLFPVRAISLADLRSLAGIVREGFGLQRRTQAELAASLAALPRERIEVLEVVASPLSAHATDPVSPTAVVAALRQVASLGEPTKRDDGIGQYLMADISRAERDALARALWGRGVTPGELDRLERVFGELKDLPPDAWPRAAPSSSATV